MKVITDNEFRELQFKTKTKNLTQGGLWELNEISVIYDCPIYSSQECNCPHLGEKYIVRTTRPDGNTFDTIYANCPRAIVASNEGNCNTTGVCYDCLLEAKI